MIVTAPFDMRRLVPRGRYSGIGIGWAANLLDKPPLGPRGGNQGGEFIAAALGQREGVFVS